MGRDGVTFSKKKSACKACLFAAWNLQRDTGSSMIRPVYLLSTVPLGWTMLRSLNKQISRLSRAWSPTGFGQHLFQTQKSSSLPSKDMNTCFSTDSGLSRAPQLLVCVMPYQPCKTTKYVAFLVMKVLHYLLHRQYNHGPVTFSISQHSSGGGFWSKASFHQLIQVVN